MLKNTNNQKATPQYWNKRAEESKDDMELVYNSAQSFARSTAIGEALIRLFVRPEMRVLDAGCGYGRFYPAFKQAGANYTGMDFSDGMLMKARDKNPGGNFIMGNWYEPPKEQFYDLVFASICLSSFSVQTESGSIDEFVHALERFTSYGGIVIAIEASEIRIKTGQNLFLL